MRNFHVAIIIIIQLRIYREYKFKYASNNELLVERVKRGKEAFDEILKAKRKAEEEYQKRKKNGRNKEKEDYDSCEGSEGYADNVYVKEIKCYEYVLNQLNNLNMYNCNEINENNKSLLALAKTKCIFVKSIRSFPEEKSGCVLNTKKLNKLQIYLYNNNLFDQFQNEDFAKTLNLDELRKIENTKNPCLNDTYDEYGEYPYIANSASISPRRNYSDDNGDDYDDDSGGGDGKDEDGNYRVRSDGGFMSREHAASEDANLMRKLCENLKYKIVTNCTTSTSMSDTAFQIYHAELNHIDDICFYIQSTEWNRRTEENINRLAETSLYITKQMTTNLENMKLIEHAQVKQIENTNRFDNFLKGLKNDFSEIIKILLKIKHHHESVTKFVRGFKMFVIYMLIGLLVLLVTSRRYAYNSRRKIITCVFFCCLTEVIFKKIISLIRKYLLLGVNENLVVYSIKGIRYTFVALALKILVTTIISYREPVKVIEEELKYIKKLIEKNEKYLNEYNEIKRQNEQVSHEMDQETANVLNLWLNYNEYLDSIYMDDEDFSITSHGDSGLSSSDTSLESENFASQEICEPHEDPIGLRIKTLHRKKRPIFFHYFPSPRNIKAYTENPISFTNIVEHNHNEMMKMREKRIKNFENGEDSDHTIILENDNHNTTCNLSELSEHEVKVNKFYSLEGF
ncbi:nuclear fusion protein, putative [Plasmodium ovale]|uniref:Nuclear fusion protein, putative n=1 Tax=Plasmodium ovale TaxID=36330 RepID=A0A1D3TIT1_PLAOA|nr:nuclear fusion protein, putative [Plasmodium ovale]